MDADAIQDLFQELGSVRCRRMFGGQGLFAGERMFGIEAGGEIYLKTDDLTRPAFETAGSRPFTYARAGRSVALGYWLMPGEGLDDPSAAARWARLAIDAATRAGRTRRPRSRRS